MTVKSTNEEHRELTLLEQIENDFSMNRSTLERKMGSSFGTTNWQCG